MGKPVFPEGHASPGIGSPHPTIGVGSCVVQFNGYPHATLTVPKSFVILIFKQCYEYSFPKLVLHIKPLLVLCFLEGSGGRRVDLASGLGPAFARAFLGCAPAPVYCGLVALALSLM